MKIMIHCILWSDGGHVVFWNVPPHQKILNSNSNATITNCKAIQILG